MKRTSALLLALTLTLAGCASGGGGGEEQGFASEVRAPTTRRNPNQLTAAELAEPTINTLTLYDAIQRLRPTWLRNRGATSVNNVSTVPQVMVNESPSSIEMLRGMRVSDVTGMEYMSGSDATTLYGTGYVNGLIKVKTGTLAPR